MEMVSAGQIDEAMRLLIEWHEDNPERVGMPPELFASKVKDARQVYEALLAEKLIERKQDSRNLPDGKFQTFYCAELTDKGKLYFIEQQRKQRISRRQFGQSFAIAVISAVVSTILTLFVSQRSEESETSSSQV